MDLVGKAVEPETSTYEDAGESPAIQAKAAAERLAAHEKERSVGTERYLVLGYLVAVCLCFLVAGIVVAVLPVPTQALVPLLSSYSVLVVIFLTATVYVTTIKSRECRHPLPLFVFAQGLSIGVNLGFLPGYFLGLFSDHISDVSKDASLALSISEASLFLLGSTVTIGYMFHMERTSPHFEEQRRLRAIIAKSSKKFNAFTLHQFWIAGGCGVSVNAVTLLVLYALHSSEISSHVLTAEVVGKVVMLVGVVFLAVRFFRRRNVQENVADRVQPARSRSLIAFAMGFMIMPIVDGLVSVLIFAAVNGGFAQPGSAYERIGNVVVVVAGSMFGVGLLMLFGILMGRKGKASVNVLAPTV